MFESIEGNILISLYSLYTYIYQKIRYEVGNNMVYIWIWGSFIFFIF